MSQNRGLTFRPPPAPQKQRRPLILKPIPFSGKGATPLQAILKSIYPNANLRNLERSADALRRWLITDENAISHLQALLDAGWTTIIIKETIGVANCPARHVSANILLQHQHILQGRGADPYVSRRIVLRSRGVHLAGGPEALDRKLMIIFPDQQWNETLQSFLERPESNIALSWPEERIRSVAAALLQESCSPKQLPFEIAKRFRSEQRAQALVRSANERAEANTSAE